MRSADQTARARIRDAALARFGADGVNRVSVRAIAADAGVSPALVLHHFGSKDGLRAECDAYVIDVIRNADDRAESLSNIAALSDTLNSAAPLRRYLARTLLDGSPAGNELFDEIVELTASSLQDGQRAGWAQPASDPPARAAVYVCWLLAPLVLGDHLTRSLGAEDLHQPEATMRYSHAMVEMLTRGVFADEQALRAWDAMDPPRASNPDNESLGHESAGKGL